MHCLIWKRLRPNMATENEKREQGSFGVAAELSDFRFSDGDLLGFDWLGGCVLSGLLCYFQ